MLRFRLWALVNVPSGHMQLEYFPDSLCDNNQKGYRRADSPVANSFNLNQISIS